MSAPFRLEPLNDRHDRDAFACGQEALDRYLRTQATQDIRRRIAACFVAVENSSERIAGFYTLAAASIPTNDLPAEVIIQLPRYPTLPAVRIGRLAVDLNFRGRGLGAGLLADALRRILVSPTAAFTMLVDAKDENAVAFYERYGFKVLVGHTRTLFLPIASAEKTLSSPN
ncbi:MAG TPA: GNAT family N-acetyltransferase [Bryobacteraceae bacterium]|nr:GNAT family N-acetyltransferase [Bryobacteraceae bacterium]